ncbi:MAG TPA: PAS domain S-box protein, partial [Brevundimonas sp.]|nr:PAS domain S-box protein [Brevundimonas sp.]
IDAGVAGLLRSPPPTGWRSVLIGLVCALVFLALWKGLSLIDNGLIENGLIADTAVARSLIGGGFGLMILLPAVLIAGLVGGRAAAMTAVAAGLLGDWLMFGMATGTGWVADLLFLTLGILTGLVAAACRTAVGRAYIMSAPDVAEMLEALAAQERRQTFLLMLADSLRDLSSPDAIMGEVERSLGAVLKADRVGYGEVNLADNSIVMSRDWTAGVVSAEGRFSLEALGAGMIDDLAEGQLIRVSDVRTDPRTQTALQTFEGLQTRALMRAPVIRGGQLKAFLYVHNATPRGWTDAEADLLQDVAERTWTEIEHSRAEDELRESEQRFRVIADTAPVLIWVTGEHRARAFVNQAYVDYYGTDYDRTVQLTWTDILHPDDHDRILDEAAAGEATRQPFSMEARYRRHDGQYRWLRSFSRPRLNAAGAVIGFVGVAFDITEARQAEADLKRINELLEYRVNEALAEKAKAEGDLAHAQRMEAVGRLTGGVAHDFNNLLTVVIGALDILLRSPDDPVKRQKMGEAALAAARRGERLTHQLLAFSRRQTLRPEVVDLSAVILDGEPLLKRAVGDAVELRLDLQPGQTRVHIDVPQFEAALLNLVVNARQAVR